MENTKAGLSPHPNRILDTIAGIHTIFSLKLVRNSSDSHPFAYCVLSHMAFAAGLDGRNIGILLVTLRLSYMGVVMNIFRPLWTVSGS